MTTQNESYMDMMGLGEPSYDDVAVSAPVPVPYGDTVTPSPVCAPVPKVQVTFKDLVQSTDSCNLEEDSYKLDLSVIVEVFCPIEGKLIESGVLTKRIMLSKQLLATELMCKSASVVYTEAVVESVIETTAPQVQVAEGVATKATDIVKRMRELAGIANPGNYI